MASWQNNSYNIPQGKRYHINDNDYLPLCAFYHRRDNFACPQRVEKMGEIYCPFHIQGNNRKRKGLCISSFGNAFKCNNYVTRGEIVCDHHLRAQKKATTRVLNKKKRKLEEVSASVTKPSGINMSETAQILQEPISKLGKSIGNNISKEIGQLETRLIERLDQKLEKFLNQKSEEMMLKKEKEIEKLKKEKEDKEKEMEEKEKEIRQRYNNLLEYTQKNMEQGEILPFQPI